MSSALCVAVLAVLGATNPLQQTTGTQARETTPAVRDSDSASARRTEMGRHIGRSAEPRGFPDRYSDFALRRFQREHGLTENGLWTTFVNWGMYDRLVHDERRDVLDLAQAA